MGSVTVASLQVNNGGQSFGLLADTSIRSVKLTNPSFTFVPASPTPQGRGDFQVFLSPPHIRSALAQDTARGGTTNQDGLTSDPALAGRVTDANGVAALRLRFDDTPGDQTLDLT